MPKNRKPRERLLANPEQEVGVVDLLAIILGTGGNGSGVLEVAEKVKNQLADDQTSIAKLQEIPGVGVAKALRIIAALRLADSLRQQSAPQSLNDPVEIYQAMQDICLLPQEHLVAFYLTVRHTRIAREIVSIGTLSASLLHPREVYREAICHNAAYLVLSHNHPSGSVEPSAADLKVTREMAEAGRLLGIQLLDHVICSTRGYFSIVSHFNELFFS